MNDEDKEKLLDFWWNNYTVKGKSSLYMKITKKSIEQTFNEDMGEHSVLLI